MKTVFLCCLSLVHLVQLLCRRGSRPSHHAGFGQQSVRGGALGVGVVQNHRRPEDALCKDAQQHDARYFINVWFHSSRSELTHSSVSSVVLWQPGPGAGSEEPHCSFCWYTAGTCVCVCVCVCAERKSLPSLQPLLTSCCVKLNFFLCVLIFLYFSSLYLDVSWHRPRRLSDPGGPSNLFKAQKWTSANL